MTMQRLRMKLILTALTAALVTITNAQQTTVSGTTYSSCHAHGVTQYCYGPDGEETPLAADATASITSGPASASATATATGQTTAVTACHAHGDDTFCIDGKGSEVLVEVAATATGEMPSEYTGCHAHGDEMYCLAEGGDEVRVLAAEGDAHAGEAEGEAEEGEMDCHFHAGVEHCIPKGGSENSLSEERNCAAQTREYDIPLRVGTLFAMLATSAIAVFLPMVLDKLPFRAINGILFTGIKQFGTGVIIATGFVHLYTHAYLMFTNPCIGTIRYEATTSAFVMAGLFLSFLVECIGHRIVMARSRRSANAATLPTSESNTSGELSAPAIKGEHHHHGAVQESQPKNLAALGHHHGGNHGSPTDPNSRLSVMVMEAGVLFHSILIGITLVVAGDSFYRTLLVVIIFHQMFEGLALGARIALLREPTHLWPTKILMGLAFALITPLGMAIGIGVLNQFNGNDPTTLWVIGTLDALSAGVLIWVGVVDMWARDWVVDGGDMVEVGWGRGGVGMGCLVSGLVVMSVLGKWA